MKRGLIAVERYLSVRLLLFRPFLLQMHHRKTNNVSGPSLYLDDQVMQHVVYQCQIQCTKAAGDIIEFIVKNLPEQTQAYILPSNWYTVSCESLSQKSRIVRLTIPRCIYGGNCSACGSDVPPDGGILSCCSFERPFTSGSRNSQRL